MKNYRKRRLNTRNEKECRERVKKAAKTLGDMVMWCDDKDVASALNESAALLAYAVKEMKFISFNLHDVMRWFRSVEGEG